MTSHGPLPSDHIVQFDAVGFDFHVFIISESAFRGKESRGRPRRRPDFKSTLAFQPRSRRRPVSSSFLGVPSGLAASYFQGAAKPDDRRHGPRRGPRWSDLAAADVDQGEPIGAAQESSKASSGRFIIIAQASAMSSLKRNPAAACRVPQISTAIEPAGFRRMHLVDARRSTCELSDRSCLRARTGLSA